MDCRASEISAGRLPGLLKSQPDQIGNKVEQLLKRNKDLEKELAAAKQALDNGSGSHDQVGKYRGDQPASNSWSSRMDGADAKTLRDAVDSYKDKLQSAIVVLGSVDGGVVRLAAGCHQRQHRSRSKRAI